MTVVHRMIHAGAQDNCEEQGVSEKKKNYFKLTTIYYSLFHLHYLMCVGGRKVGDEEVKLSLGRIGA